MRSSTALLLLASCVSAFPAVYRRQDASTTLSAIETNTEQLQTVTQLSTSTAQVVIVPSTTVSEVPSSMESEMPSSVMESAMPSSASEMMSSMSGESAMESGSGVAAVPLPSASTSTLSLACPEGYQSGSYNITRELAADAQTIAAQIGDFTNFTWVLQGTNAGANGYTGLGQTVGATRTLTVNQKDLTETLTRYTLDNSTGQLNQTWILSNGPQDFGSNEATLVSYVSELQLTPSESSEDNSTLTWNTVFCSGDLQLFEGFFQQLHEPPMNQLGNSTAEQAMESMSIQSVGAAETSAAAQSLFSIAESASLAAVSLTQALAQPTSSRAMGTAPQPSVVTVTVSA